MLKLFPWSTITWVALIKAYRRSWITLLFIPSLGYLYFSLISEVIGTRKALQQICALWSRQNPLAASVAGQWSFSFHLLIGFMCPSVGSSSAAGLACVRRGQRLPHAEHGWFQLVPARSNRPTAWCSWAHQQYLWCVCDNIFKKKPWESEKNVRETAL